MNDPIISGASLVFTNGIYLHCPPDERFFLNLASYNADEEVLGGKFDLSQTIVKHGKHTHVGFFSRVVEEFLPEGASWRMLDIGGYIGAIGLPIAKWARDNFSPSQAHIDIFEPTGMSKMISQSIILNGLEEFANVHPFAVSNKTGEAGFSHMEGQKVAGRIGGGQASKTIVNTIEMDKFITDIQEGLLIVKIDTEGHEPAVLTGMSGLLERNRVVAVIEFHSFCIGQKVGNTTYEDFLFDRFHLFDVGNIGYPGNVVPVEPTLEGLRALDRDGFHLTDILCIDKRIPQDSVDRFLNGCKS